MLLLLPLSKSLSLLVMQSAGPRSEQDAASIRYDTSQTSVLLILVQFQIPTQPERDKEIEGTEERLY